MATNELHDTTERLRIEGTDDLLRQVIEDQAEDVEHAWREAIQNGLDSPMSTRVELDWNRVRSIIADNGDGVDLTQQYGEELLTNLGESSKDADDDETIGEFGIGKGQVFAKARTAMLSGDQALLFDIKGKGLEVLKCSAEDAATVAGRQDEDWASHIVEARENHDLGGLLVVMSHYDDEVPDYSFKWDNYEERVTDRFKYAELATATRVEINGERISDASVNTDTYAYTHVEEFDGDEAGRVHIGVGNSIQDDIAVYSNGVYVTDVDGRGLGGDVVVEGNLKLNFARNGIQSGCPKWAEITERLDTIRLDLFDSMPDDRLNSDAREFLAKRVLDGDDRFTDTAVLRTASGDLVSLEEAQSRKNVGVAEPGDKAADKLEEMGSLVLDESDDATSEALYAIDDESHEVEMETYEAEEKAEKMGIHSTYERLDQGELRPLQRKQLAIARELGDRLNEALDEERQIYYGKSDVAKAWTDGITYITITDDSTSSNKRAVWVPELFRQLVHEFSHTVDSKENQADHGIGYNSRYRETMDGHHDILTGVISEIEERGLGEVVADAPKY